MKAKVVDFNGEEEVHIGNEGELCIRGPNVAKGYWRNPDATEKSFGKDGWLRTGDAATIDAAGNLSVLARVQVSCDSPFRKYALTPLEHQTVRMS